ncbi:MAG: hypothetical protein LC753_15960 [Acidobacteria bacterium]|nr:hypothetical protein [Acidobacteriota bacterium]
MLSLYPKLGRRISPAPPRGLRGGFTLAEIFISLAVLGVMSSGCYVGFNAINTYAVSSRLYSEALTAAQNQTDLILSKDPFDIMDAYLTGSFSPAANKIPIELMTVAELDALAASGVTFPTEAPTARPAKTDPYYPYYPYYRSSTGMPIQKEAFIYTDPTSGRVIVKGVLTATITDSGATMNFVTSGTKLNTRRATVSVDYTFRSRRYQVAMDTMRTANQ